MKINKQLLVNIAAFIVLMVTIGFLFMFKQNKKSETVTTDEMVNAIQKAEETTGNVDKEVKVSIPDEKWKKWNEVYQDLFVIHIRKALNGYLNSTNEGMSDPNSVIEPLKDDKQHITGLSTFSKDYYKSKFIVLSIANNPFGGKQINILFQDKPDKVFWVWVYKPEGADYDLRGFQENTKFTKADIENFKNNNKTLLDDKEHAL